MMFRHQMTGSWQDSKNCRLPRMSRVPVALLALACTLLMCGVAGAVDYDTITVTSTNCTEWSTNLSNNVSTVQGNIIVNDGAVLSIANATVKMRRISYNNYPSIIVRENGTLNVNDSTITRYNYYYGWTYENGSRGNVTNSTATFCIYNNGFKIETNETVALFNVTFDHGNYAHPAGDCYGIYLNSASNASIRECTMKTSSSNTDSTYRYTYGIYIKDSELCNLTDNTIKEKGSLYHGIHLQNSENNTLINNSITRGAYSSTGHDAVHLESSFNNTLRDTRIAGSANQDGVHASTSSNTSIINSTINGVRNHGIYIQNSNYCNISENDVTDSGDYGIYIQNSENAILLSNDLDRNRDGMNFESSTNSTLTGNTITDSSEYGINITSSHDSILRSNDIINSTDYNLYVTGNYDQDVDTSNTVNGGRVYYNYTDSGTITDQNIGHATIVDCTDLWFTGCMIHNGDGVRIRGVSSNVSIVGGEIENNTMYGINFESTSWNNITSVTIENNTKQGVYFEDSGNNLINDSYILDNTGRGIDTLGSSSDNRIINNSIINNSIGIYLDGNGDNNLTDNNVSENRGSGICIGKYHEGSASTHNTLHNNTVYSNDGTGIEVYTNFNYLSNNTINNTISSLSSQYALKVSHVRDSYYNYIWRNNTANGEEVNYYYNEQDITIESKNLLAYNVSNVGKITLIDCTNITIRDSELSNNSLSDSYGIFLWNSNNNNLTNNTMWDNHYGIKLDHSSSNNITDLDTTSQNKGAYLYSNSDYNNLSDSSITAIDGHGMDIASLTDHTPDHTTVVDTTISSVNQYGLSTSGAHYTNLTNVTITSSLSDGVHLFRSDNIIIRESSITASNTGMHCTNSNHTDIITTTIEAGTDGIHMSQSHWGNLTNNTIDAIERGVFLTTSRDHNLTANTITNYTTMGTLLEEYSTNTTMIGNDLTWDGPEFDIRINDSNGAVIANNESTAANYVFYLTNNTTLCTFDTVFDKTKVGYEDTSNLTLMWRIDVLCWDNYHIEFVWANLTVRYGDFSNVGNVTVWGEDEIPLSNYGRLSGNDFDYYGPPTSSDNWLPIIEYKENVTGKTTYQPMNCTAINRWDKIQGKNITYRNITTTITGPGVTILVDTGYTPNGKCYYCHLDKLKFRYTLHWTNYSSQAFDKLEEPYTPGQCIDCHNENDSIAIPHGNESGKDLLYQQSPQLCYTGRTGGLDCHSANVTQARLDQETEFNQTTHHQLGDGKLSCKACHDNHGTDPKHQFDLLRKYKISETSGYDSANFALCYVCHLEEKIVAKMHESGGNAKSRHLQNYTNQTNFRDEYHDTTWGHVGFNGGLQNVHSPQSESKGTHTTYNCYACHSPHGAVDPAMTRYKLNYTYITNITPPGVEYEFGDWANQTVLVNQSDWSNSTLNQGGGTWTRRHCRGDRFGCHSGGYGAYGNLKNYFVYREFVNYEPAGGAGCLECHDNNASAYNTDPIRPIVNLTAVKLAMHTNLSGAFRTGSDLQGTDRNFDEWLQYRGYTGEQMNNITEDNAICWACHCTNGTPPSPYFHPDRALNPYKCAKCHGPYDGQPPHTQGLVAAIDNHGPTTKGAESILIQTDVGNGGSCGDCHAPSKLPNSSIGDLKVWKWNGGEITYQGRTIMGDVSHYGLNKSQGQGLIDNPLVNTTDCLFCHCNWTNGQIWGNATNISGNMYGADTTNITTCYTYCHVRPDWAGVNNSTLSHFHNKSIYAGGGPNCTLCHDIGSTYGVQSLVNATAIANGIHGNILNNTLVHEGYGMDNRSNPCWGCHNSDGTIPEGMGDRNGITDINDDGVITVDEMPYTCEDCHARSDVWNSATSDGETWQSASDPDLGLNKLPPVIYTHYPNSSTLKTDINGRGRCVDCHNNSIDSHRNDTAEKIIGNTIFANVSHYGTTTDLICPTADCAICHHNATNGTIWGDAPQNTHGNFTDYSNPEDGCYICHTNDNETPVDLHAANMWSGKGGFECLSCHDKEGFAKRKRINGSVFGEAMHWNTNNISLEYGLNRSCWVCHFENGTNANNHSMRKDPPYLCYDCHNKNSTPLFSNVSSAPNAYNHFKNGTVVSAYWTQHTDSESCMGCHNQSEMKYPFEENDSYSTAFSVTSHYGDNRTDLVSKYDPSNSTEYCAYCHQNTSTPFMEYENDKDILHDRGRNCNRNNCHGAGRLHEDTLVRPKTSSKCLSCHELTPSDKLNRTVYLINITAMNLGVHKDVNINMSGIASGGGGGGGGGGSGTNADNAKCWGCHVIGGVEPVNGHEDIMNNNAYLCYECHNSTYAYQNVSNATAVYNHFVNGINISCTDAETNSSSCGYCHNLTSMKVSDFNAGENVTYRLNMSQSSHYPWNRTDIIIADDLSDCAWCHRNSTNEFLPIFERAGPPNYTANIPHATQTSGCIVPECHDRGRIHDLPLKIPALNWSEACKSCHFGMTDSDAYVNGTMFNASVHGDVNCTKCHVNEEMDHPVEEYTWKWCECCHAYQSDPLNETDRHNVTADPANYSAKGVNVLTITECTECHNATAYDNAKANFNASAARDCRYCHSYPDDW